MDRIWVALGALYGLGAVGMAAVGSHVLAGRLDARALHWVDTAVQMEGWHALVLLFCGAWAARGGVLAHAAGALFAAGTLLFCGALYVLALTGTGLGVTAPVGGLCLMGGWLLLGLSTLRLRRLP